MATAAAIIAMASLAIDHSSNFAIMFIADILEAIIAKTADSINSMVSMSISCFKYMFAKATKWIDIHSIIVMIATDTTINSMDKMINTTTNINILVVAVITITLLVWT